MWEQIRYDWKEANDSVSKMWQQMIYEQAYENAIKVPYTIVEEVKLLV